MTSTGHLQIITLIVTLSITSALGLDCYHCRANFCNHIFCEEANNLMEISGIGMSEEAWKSLPLCPEDDSNEFKMNETDYVETCPKKINSCTRTIYNITTTSTKNIVPGNNSIVPIIGSGRERMKSGVIVYGCEIPKYQACSHGYALEYKVPSPPDSNSTETMFLDVIVKNTETVCCHCEHDRCNGIETSLKCTNSGVSTSGNVSDPGVGFGGSGIKNSFSLDIPLFFITGYVLTSG